MYYGFRGIWILGVIFGVLMIFGGFRALFKSRAESYDRRSLNTNIYGSVGMFILGVVLLIYSWGRVASWFR